MRQRLQKYHRPSTRSLCGVVKHSSVRNIRDNKPRYSPQSSTARPTDLNGQIRPRTLKHRAKPLHSASPSASSAAHRTPATRAPSRPPPRAATDRLPATSRPRSPPPVSGLQLRPLRRRTRHNRPVNLVPRNQLHRRFAPAFDAQHGPRHLRRILLRQQRRVSPRNRQPRRTAPLQSPSAQPLRRIVEARIRAVYTAPARSDLPHERSHQQRPSLISVFGDPSCQRQRLHRSRPGSPARPLGPSPTFTATSASRSSFSSNVRSANFVLPSETISATTRNTLLISANLVINTPQVVTSARDDNHSAARTAALGNPRRENAAMRQHQTVRVARGSRIESPSHPPRASPQPASAALQPQPQQPSARLIAGTRGRIQHHDASLTPIETRAPSSTHFPSPRPASAAPARRPKVRSIQHSPPACSASARISGSLSYHPVIPNAIFAPVAEHARILNRRLRSGEINRTTSNPETNGGVSTESTTFSFASSTYAMSAFRRNRCHQLAIFPIPKTRTRMYAFLTLKLNPVRNMFHHRVREEVVNAGSHCLFHILFIDVDSYFDLARPCGSSAHSHG